ncbi:MAG: M56 family metallopeptidase [Prevotellaceae bacterium]|nr:M56 family metallopeptidase [Prevotellaceae bacterium]
MQKTPTALRGKVHVKKELQAPFSFFAWIVLDPEKYSESELKEILLHEETHVRQGHSLDMILSEILCALCWLNPFAWLLKKEMRMNLEYLADHTVLNSGCEVKHYQLHLLRLSYTKAAATITNNFNVSPLKKRIVMMNRKKTSLASIWKYALLAPAFVLLALFNDSLKAKAQTPALAADATGTAAFVSGGNPDVAPEVEAENVQQTPQESEKASEKKVVKFTPPPPPKIVKAAKNSAQKEVFNEAEEMPQFPGGQNALMKYLSGNTKYPEAAIRDSIQGRVIVRFIIDATGKIDSVNIVKSLNATCDAEAIRVVKAMPTWIPGKNKGEAVSVAYTVPIIYKFK